MKRTNQQSSSHPTKQCVKMLFLTFPYERTLLSWSSRVLRCWCCCCCWWSWCCWCCCRCCCCCRLGCCWWRWSRWWRRGSPWNPSLLGTYLCWYLHPDPRSQIPGPWIPGPRIPGPHLMEIYIWICDLKYNPLTGFVLENLIDNLTAWRQKKVHFSEEVNSCYLITQMVIIFTLHRGAEMVRPTKRVASDRKPIINKKIEQTWT